MKNLKDTLFHILAFAIGATTLTLLAHLQHRFSSGAHDWKTFLVPISIGGTIGVSIFVLTQRIKELSNQLAGLCSSALQLPDYTQPLRKRTSALLVVLITTLSGCMLLSTLSFIQKLLNGFPIHLRGFIIPITIGSCGGLLFGLYLNKLRQFQAFQAEALSILASEKMRLANIIETINDGILVTDNERKIELINPAGKRYLGIDAAELQDKDLWECLRDLTNPYQQDEFHLPKANIPFFVEAKQTGRILCGTFNSLQNKDEAHTGKVLVLHDMSHEKKIERLKSEFISTATHELNTPISALAGYSELLLKGDFPPEQQKEFVEIIGRKAWQVSNILDNLLHIDSVDSPRQITLFKDVHKISDLVTVIDESADDFSQTHLVRFDIQNRDIELNVDLKQLNKVFHHLLSNAAKFSKPKSLIHVRGRHATDRYIFEIEDQGIGMSEEERTRVFDKFYRADASNTAREGIGLGMSVVKSLVEAHAGTIEIDSQPNRGTTVQLSLPLRA